MNKLLTIFFVREIYRTATKLLVAEGANVNAKNMHYQAHLSLAEKAEYTEMIKLLKSYGTK